MTNRLGGETSPYLQQHAGNPVHWHPWDDEALAIARTQDKPILLSVGYSACHWCHVMAHESFEDPGVAAVMNRLFVNIKVDREERPDIDQIYQTAHQVMTGRAGGWPLTMFLTPQQKPFFGGTYFPVRPLHGLPGFGDLLEKVAQAYRERRSDIDAQNESLMEILGGIRPESVADVALTDEPVASAVRELGGSFDERYGGLGSAPKFPHPCELAFCLRAAQSSGDDRLRDLVLLTLERMALGGIYDQLGGGFCRYSVDAHWSIPHFEKMLYDNALLLKLYADAWTLSGEPLFQRVCEETAAWVMREMQSPRGGYYSSIDADSEHEEGKFYIWSAEEVAALLPAAELEVARAHYGLDLPPNFEGRAWNLRVTRPMVAVATALGRPEAGCKALLDAARAKLLTARERRIRPGRDEKVLASWNALMIEGMAHAARVFSRNDWLQSARRATDFLANDMWRDGRLLATSRDGRSRLNAYLDDHAFLANALLELLQAGYRNADLELAIRLADALLARFEDRIEGGFFFTSHDHEALILRPKPGPDHATPSGNGVAAFALQRLGNLLAEPRYLQAAERKLHLIFPSMQRQAGAFSTLNLALMEWLTPTRTVILRGPLAELHDWQRELSMRYLPDVQAFAVDREAHGVPTALNKPAAAGVNAYVCHGVSCLAPVRSLEKLLETLEIQAA